jgi:preprotein translocase subunit SecB
MPKNPTPTSGNGPAASSPGAQGQQVQVRIAGQYIKDLSFENPNIGKLIASAPENPNLDVEINVAMSSLRPNLYESAIEFKASAENAPPQALEPMLFVNCPGLLFPFLRRIVADLTREGGFPPLLLDPVDFAALYMRKKQLGMPPTTGPSTALS